MEDDEEKLEMTYKRLNNLRLKNISLRKLSLEQTTKNICSYVEDGRLESLCLDNNHIIKEESDQSPCKNDKIQVLRRDLFKAIMKQKPPKETRGLMDDFNTRLSALTQLLESISMEMEVGLVIRDGLMPFSPDSSKESNCTRVIERISERETNSKPIKSLMIKMTFLDFDPSESEHVASEEMVNAICKLEKLEALVIYPFKLRYSDVKTICNTLSSLKYLYIMFKDEHFPDFTDIEDVKSTFSSLKSLCFPTTRPYMQLKNFCVRHLPNIELLASPVYTTLSRQTEHLPLEKSALQKLRVAPSSLRLHEMFPSASHLMIVWKDDWTHNEQELIAMLSFSKICTLSLKNVPSKEIVYRFLEKYGGDITTLQVSSLKNIFLGINLIFDCCPDLRILILTDVLLMIDSTVESCKFLKLKRLIWKNHKHHGFKVSCLSSILSAPLLDTMKIDLPHDTFDVNDLERLASLISNNEILGNLVEASGCIRFNSTRVVDHDSEIVKSLSKIIKTASAHLPNLTHLEVTQRFESPVLDYLDIILPESCEVVDAGESVSDWLNDPNLILFLKAYEPKSSEIIYCEDFLLENHHRHFSCFFAVNSGGSI